MLVISVCASGLYAQTASVTTSVITGAAWQFGSIEYDIKSESGGNGVMSRLDYPLDGLYPTVRVQTMGVRDGIPLWSLGFEGSASIIGPYGSMVDRDWNLYAGYPPVEWSYTESGSALRAFRAAADLVTYLYRGRDAQIGFDTGYSFESLYQSIDGANGWQYQPNSGTYDLVGVSISGTVATYQVYLHTLSAGLTVRYQLSPALNFGITADALAVLGFDDDDHILRTKRATATSAGGGYRLEADLMFGGRPTAGRHAGRFFGGLNGTLEGFSIVGSQTQVWYGSADSVPKGTTYTGIYHHVSALRGSVGLYAGYAF